jgi:hypothetical protein
MKQLLHSLLLLSLSVAFFACQKEIPLTGEQLPTTAPQPIEFVQLNETVSAWISDSPFEGAQVFSTPFKSSACPYASCTDEIKYWSALLQPIADSTGEIQWRSIVCCQDGYKTCMLLRITPAKYFQMMQGVKSTDLAPHDCTPAFKVPKQVVCNKIFEPVCGCNGLTYPNACFAETSGAANWAKGSCHSCQDFSLIGSVSHIPDIYDPVCGCNSVTYKNEYEAKNAGIKSFMKGHCADKGIMQPSSPHLTN